MSTRNSAPCYVAAWMGGGCWGRMDTHICTAESLQSSLKPNHNTVNWIYPNKRSKKKNTKEYSAKGTKQKISMYTMMITV